MKKQLFLLLFVFLSFTCYTQIIFEKGYYINNTGEKIEGLIKNIAWAKNPTQFDFKLTEGSEQQKLTIETVKAFGINSGSTYIRSNVDIDLSSSQFSSLSKERAPKLQNKTLFLRVLVQGQANLYAYSNGNVSKFLYNKDNSPIEQLIFKKYLDAENKIATNAGYKHQLWMALKSACISLEDFKSIDFKEKDLVDLFTTFHECDGTEFFNFVNRRKKSSLNINLRPGLSYSSVSLENVRSRGLTSADLGSELTFRIGLEAEIILPINKNKWAILIEPSYQYFEAEKATRFGTGVAKVDYKALNLALGIRHYFFLNQHSKIFINSAIVANFSTNSKIIFNLFSFEKITTVPNLALGFGYNYKGNYSLELRYLTDRDLFGNNLSWGNDYTTLSIIFGYTLFEIAR